MAIPITCPACKASYSVEDDLAGKKTRCRKCAQPVSVPPSLTGIADKKGKPDLLPGGGRGAAELTVAQVTERLRGSLRRSEADARGLEARYRREAGDLADGEGFLRWLAFSGGLTEQQAETLRTGKPAPRVDDARMPAKRDRKSQQPVKKKRSALVLILVLLLGGGLAFVAVLGILALVGGWMIFGGSSGNANAPEPVAGAVADARPVMPVNPDAGVKPPVDPNPPFQGPLPDKIADATVLKVKQSSAYLHVTTGKGRSEGSGFFAIEPGIVVTNAHVLGMMSANSPTPDSVEVVVNSGETNEITLPGTVLGVDRFTDLAIIRVAGNGIPPPLPVDSANSLKDLQKLYYFGFPFGKKLGTNITVSEASVSSIRKDPSGAIEQVQLTGNMQPGNSGGPVVDAAGQVVGVARAIIVGTGINFAIPADKIKQVLNGRVSETVYGEPYLLGDRSMLPISVQCLDPLGRIRGMKVEVWAGDAGPERPLTNQQPVARPGDGPRQSIDMNYANGGAAGEIKVPAIGPGQVLWVRPVLTDGAGATQWHTASALTPAAPLQRIAAALQIKPDMAGERSVKMKYNEGLTIYEGKNKGTEGITFDANLLEVVTPQADNGISIRVTVGANQFAQELDGKRFPFEEQYQQRLSRLQGPSFILDPTGKMLHRTIPKLKLDLVPKDKAFLEMMLDRLCNAYEEGILPMPNRTVSALETWAVSLPNFVGRAPKTKVVDIQLTCTYLGTRITKGRSEAVIDLVGAVRSREKGVKKPLGKATGRAVFDVEGGFIAEMKMRIASEHDFGPNLQVVAAENVEFLRAPGNAFGLVASAPPKPADPPPVKGGAFDGQAKGFTKPAKAATTTSYLKIVSSPGDYIGQGKNYNYAGADLMVRKTPRGVDVRVDGWMLQIGGPKGQFLQAGEYPNAKRFAFSDTFPGLDFSGNGRGSNTVAGEFVVWELVVQGDQITRLAIDFVQRSEGKNAPLTGKLRINSTLE